MSKMARYTLASVVLFLLWQAGAMLLGPSVLPTPGAAFFVLGQEATTAAFWAHAGASTYRVLAALILGFGLAFPLGIFLGAARRADAWLSPFVFLTYPIPKILFLPVFLVLFGLGDAPKILLIALTVGYQILVVTRDNVRTLDRRYIDSFRSLSRDKLLLLRHVLVPAALPAALTSLRIAGGTAVAVLFLAESFVTDAGLGYLIIDAWGRMDLPLMFAGIIAMSLLGVLLYEGCNALEKICCRWL